MKAHHCGLGAFVAVALALSASAQEGTAKRTGKIAFYETPQDVFKVAAKAVQNEDWKTFSMCLTPSSRDEFAGGMLFGLLAQKGALEKAPEEVRTKMRKQLKPMDDLLSKYGITEEKLKELAQPEGGSNPRSLAGQKQLMRKLSTSLLKDRTPFIADFMATEKKIAESRGKKRPADFNPGKLVNLQVRGDTATGFALAKQGGKDVRVPLTFHRGPKNGWRMEVPRRPIMNTKAPPKKEPALPRPGS